MKQYGFGIDVGGTTVKLGFFDQDTLMDKWEIPTNTAEGGTAILPDIARAVQSYLASHGILKDQVMGLGVGVPGAVLPNGVVNRCVNLGWGVLDIAGEAVRRMGAEYGCRPADVHAAIGPCIGPCCFETGPEVPAALREALGAAAEGLIVPRGEKFLVDLKGANRLFLERAGVPSKNIDVSDVCTMCHPETYWSHRYTQGQRGVQGSLIML